MKALAPELELKIDEIHGWMFYGDVKEVAKRSRTWPTRVSAMLNKRIPPDKKVLEHAIELMNENKARFECNPKLRIA